jgi:predicted dehydrogenase
MVNVGIIGIGGMGRTHFQCYRNNPDAHIVALSDVDPRKLAGDWSGTGINIDAAAPPRVDLSGIKTYQQAHDLIADPEVELVSICLPTPMHAPLSMAALRAGKHVLCEKPMAMNGDECQAMADAAQESGRQLMIGHCLRFWPQYVKAHEIIQSGAYGRPLYARFHRAGATPLWGWNNWLTKGEMSGGAVLDMHIHDVDTALWWFGTPASIDADGLLWNGMPAKVDAVWRYDAGPVVYLHGGWDNNGGPFRMAFSVTMDKGTVAWDSSAGTPVQVYSNLETTSIDVPGDSAYQNEINAFIACLEAGRPMQLVTPASSRASVEAVVEELRQIAEKNAGSE